MAVNIYDMTDTWNDGGTTFDAIKMDVTDTASAAGSNLLWLGVGGVNRFRVQKDGHFSSAGLSTSGNDVIFSHSSADLFLGNSSAATITAGFFRISSDAYFGISSGLATATQADVRLYRDAAGTLAQRNSTNAQTFNIYNTYTDASNGEWLEIGWAANVASIAPKANGTGAVRVLHISGLPTANPGAGILWNDSGTVKVGT